ncbi:MAG: hypothetical protein LC772_05050 [Chloroflexi bacterium]|nr:hypothetical protein [Chloroflexota bacterium]
MSSNTSGVLFDPEKGITIAAPGGAGPGWWAGAPAVYFDSESGFIYLVYRLRQPRGVVPDRGGTAVLARSLDGITFETIWTMTKTDLGSPSLERSDLIRLPDRRWAMYISFVDGATNQWRTDMMIAPNPESFNPANRRKVFEASDIGLAAVKDPVVISAGGATLMYLSCAAPRSAQLEVDHTTADAYDTGTILAHTGLAVSFNGVKFNWEGLVLEAPDDGGWDSYSARMTTIVPVRDRWLAFYDGARGTENHYDETTGAAISTNLKTWTRLTPDAPALAGPDGRCLRYMDVIVRGPELFMYYEYGRADGSHELRLNRAPANALEAWIEALQESRGT